MDIEPELLHQRVAVVTGGAGAIGIEICRMLLKAGMQVVLTARSQTRAEEAAATLAGQEEQRIFVRALEVTNAEAVAAFARAIAQTHGRIDVLINNAGVPPRGHGLSDMSDDELDLALRTHFHGPLHLIRAALPMMRTQGYGRIVNVSSSLGQLSQMGARWPAYRLSKAALNALTAVVAAEVAGSDILVNAVCPGWCRTPLGGPEAPRSAAEGAADIVWAAMLPDGSPSGHFFRDRQIQPW